MRLAFSLFTVALALFVVWLTALVLTPAEPAPQRFDPPVMGRFK